MENDLFQVFRRAGTKYVANIAKTRDGRQTFYQSISNVSQKLGKGRMCGTKCCNRFQCLEEEGESDFEPIGIHPLNFGFEGASRAKIDLQKKIPVMGKGPVIGSEIEVGRALGNPTLGKMVGRALGNPTVGRAVGNPTIEKKIGRAVGNPKIEKTVGRATGNPTNMFTGGRALREAPCVHGKEMFIGGRALREAPYVHRRTYAEALNGGKQVVTSGSAQVTVTGASVPPLSTLGSLGIRMPEGLKSVEEVAPEWEEIEMAVDSGASESVVSEDMLTGVETVEGYAQKKGVQYEVADGALIPNLGEKKFVAVSDAGVTRAMKAQVCDVNKALLSVHRVVQAGNRVVFAASGSYVQDETSGETMALTEKGGMYMLKLWVKAQGFGGPVPER